jgi:shikimate kinase
VTDIGAKTRQLTGLGNFPACLYGHFLAGMTEKRAESGGYTSPMNDSPGGVQGAAPHSVGPVSGEIERVILTGFMGAGKSTVGHLLARQSGWEFLDLDTHIERTNGASARELFATLGESGFRQLEGEVFASALTRSKIILAPGGAVIDKIENQRALASSTNKLIVFLDGPFQRLIERCKKQEQMGDTTYRPLLHQTATANARYEARKLLYARHAQVTVDVAEKSAEEVAQIILERMRRYSRLASERVVEKL